MLTRYRLFAGILLATILLLALFLRSADLAHLPSGLYPDEAVNGIDALNAIESSHYAIFYPNNYGREGLFINLQALALKLFGTNIVALKLFSVFFGTLAVLGTYLLAKELLHRRSSALIAAFLIATSYWAINFSRIGFRAIMLPFIFSFTFYFFFRGLRKGGYASFILSGLFFGLGLNTYISWRIAPLILVLLVPFLMLSYQNFIRRFWKQALVFLLAAVITAGPILFHFFVSHPEDFASRTGAVSVFSPEVNQGQLGLTLAKTVGLSLVKYNFWGDQNWRHNYPPYPVLDPFSGILFLGGFLFLIFQTVTLLWRRIAHKDRDTRLVRDAFLLIAFFAMLIPEFLTAEGLPHALRAIGTQVPVFIIAALSAAWLAKRALQSQSRKRLVLLGILGIFLFASASINIVKYFVFFRLNPAQASAFNENYTLMSRYLLSLPPETHKYVYANAGGTTINNGLPVTAQPIVFLTHNRIENLEFLNPDTKVQMPAVIILQRHDEALMERIKKKKPGAIFETIDLDPGSGTNFTVITLP
ncbi:MAG: glycosyltransferase family 39 protein [Candidatus Moraniibacteriota bacterium]